LAKRQYREPQCYDLHHTLGEIVAVERLVLAMELSYDIAQSRGAEIAGRNVDVDLEVLALIAHVEDEAEIGGVGSDTLRLQPKLALASQKSDAVGQGGQARLDRVDEPGDAEIAAHIRAQQPQSRHRARPGRNDDLPHAHRLRHVGA